MKIKRELPQFEDKKTLLLVTGKQEAVIYIAYKGVIEKIVEVKVETPKYSDREGFFARTGRGKNLGSGSAYEDAGIEIKKQFFNEISTKLKILAKNQKIRVLYLFTPVYMSKQLPAALPKSIANAIVAVYHGNFRSEHPFILLAKISSDKKIA